MLIKPEELAEVHHLSSQVGSGYETTVEIVRRRSGENHHMISATDETITYVYVHVQLGISHIRTLHPV